jgi:hypothetical protein
MTSIDTATIEVVDQDPEAMKAGQIQGRVLEGPRPQPNLTVILSDEQGKEIARTRTQPDGTFSFAGVAPGRYRLSCVKPESQRRATLGIIVEPQRTSKVELSLKL